MDYGLFIDNNGETTTNLEAALVVEGVLLLGGGRSGMIELDALFPLREHFGGIFVMPLPHAFAANAATEHTVSVYWDKGRLLWTVPHQADNLYTDLPWSGGQFAGRQFLYGYWNK